MLYIRSLRGDLMDKSTISLLKNKSKLQIDQIDDFETISNIVQIEKGYVIKRIIKNTTNKTLLLHPTSLCISNINFNGKRKNDYFYCSENARLFCTLTVPVDYNYLNDGAQENKALNLPVDRKWCDPGVIDGKICSSPYQPFPAILISNYEVNNGIVCGSLSQEVFYHSFEVGHDDKGVSLKVYSSFKDIAFREVEPQEELIDIIYVGETENADDINLIFENYTAVLRDYLKNNSGSSVANRHSLIWDSWNDGVFSNISEEMLLKEAHALKKYFHNVEWFQMDAGYSACGDENIELNQNGICVVYEGDEGIDGKKFPNGLKSYTDKIKAIGFKPAIWIGGWCPVKTKIYQEKPEWFIDYKYRTDFAQPLDVSIKDARDYMCFALDKLIQEYGFEGVKHDFWSYAFEDRHDLLKNKTKSGYEWRAWWISQIRRRLPNYGYIQSTCDIGAGNPFLGKYFNNYRFGLDVQGGDWERIITSMFWSVVVLSPHTGDLFIPNSDSIGLLPGLNDDDFLFVVNWQIITRTIVEIAGRFSLVDEKNPRLKILQRAVQYLNNGENVYFAKYDYRSKGINLPQIIYINSAFDCEDTTYKTVAIFNSGEESKKISFTNSDVQLIDGIHEVEFVWENRKELLKEYNFQLKGHQSMLLKIKK